MGVPGSELRGWRWLAGRANRIEYGLWAAIALLASLVLTAPMALIAAGLALLFQQIRRLHDFGWSGWWVAGAYVVQIAVYAGASAVADVDTALSIANLVVLGFAIAIGAIPGSKHANRFGSPPGRPSVAATFD